jgi:Protein of unknown function (DUF3619)
MNRLRTPASPLSVEARLAARLAGALSVNAQKLPHDVSERLRFARDKALARAREGRAVTVTGVSARGDAVLGGLWWHRAASALPLLVLVAGLVLIDHWVTREQVLTAADLDAQILADDLPPAAYSDPGFVEFLRSPPAQP